MPTFDVIVIGGLNTDFMAKGRSLPRPGETKDGETFLIGPGGKGANQAVAIARLGARVALIGAVGDDDRGRALVEIVRAEGVNVEHIRRIDTAPSGAAVIHVDERAQKQIFAVPGANHSLTVEHVRDALAALSSVGARLQSRDVSSRSSKCRSNALKPPFDGRAKTVRQRCSIRRRLSRFLTRCLGWWTC